MLELELKARVDDPDAVRAALRRHGATCTFAGRLQDRRHDRGGELAEQDQVLRVRHRMPLEGTPTEVVAWKGPTHTHDGYKARLEHEAVLAPGERIGAIIDALGYQVTEVIDRHVEVWQLDGGAARIEWYPEMDVLLEVEGDAAAIERLISATGLPREAFSAEPLPAFAAAYQRRTGRTAVLALSDGPPSHWPRGTP
ncbi:MAG TPA: hypothetical protein VFN22_11430 [Gemmatimonadales bacterium]|nr:hypothetical protein [Gemmatimonadales bacterium]